MNTDTKYVNSTDLSSIRPFFLSIGTLVEYKKGECLTKQDCASKYIGYIETGTFRHETVDESGVCQLVGYSFHNGLIINYPSFLNQPSSLTNIQAVCDCRVYLITYDELMTHCKINPDFDRLYKQAIEEFFIVIYKRLLSFYCNSPEYRYKELLRRNPNLVD